MVVSLKENDRLYPRSSYGALFHSVRVRPNFKSIKFRIWSTSSLNRVVNRIRVVPNKKLTTLNWSKKLWRSRLTSTRYGIPTIIIRAAK